MPERYFKQYRAAERFQRQLQKKGFLASVHEEPVDPQASTRRKRAQRIYQVVWGTRRELLGNPVGAIPTRWTPATVKRLRGGRVQIRIGGRGRKR